MAHLEFFFDLSSPWTRLAFHNIQPIATETGATVVLRPFLVGGVFNAVNQDAYESRADVASSKNRHTLKWLGDWARLAGVPMNFPSPYHPARSVAAMRFCCALEDDQSALHRFATTAFAAYFGDARDLDDPAVLVSAANAAGLDGERLSCRAQEPDIKAKLRKNTQEAVDRGAFGSPTLFLGLDEMFFGNDQLPLVRQALLGRSAQPGASTAAR